MRDMKRSIGLLAAAALLIVACAGPAATVAPTGGAPTGAPTQAASDAPSDGPVETAQVSLQLQWEPQAQFAGYFAADAEGYYEEEGLQVEMLPAGAEIFPHVVGSEENGPDFTISWVPKVLEVRANGASDLVNIAQIFQ